jgi:hypothetical protein
MGFLKFLLAIVMMIGGPFIMFAGFATCGSGQIFSSVNGGSSSGATGLGWIIFIVGFVVFFGGVYMLRNRR